jgi:phytoene dehydrogenase-like protein
MTEQISVVVIGAGHNGLVCAAYLARAGCRVQVLEAREVPGGGASTRSFAQDYKVSGLAHILHSLNPKVCKDLKLAEAGLEAGARIDTISLARGGNHLVLGRDTASGGDLSPQDVAAYAGFKQEFRAYAAALEPLLMNRPPRLKNMDRRDKLNLARIGWKLRFGLGAESMREFLRVGGMNMYDVLNDTFDSPGLKGALAADAVLGHNMGPRSPGTVLTWLYRLWGETGGAQTLPPGGMGSVAKTLAAAAEKVGASIRTNAGVSRVLVKDGRATGVLLESGEQIDADLVVSNADAKTTFLRLVGTPELDALFAHRVHKTRTRGSAAKLHLALNGLPEIKGLSASQLGQRLLIAPDMTYVEHAFNHAKYGEFSERPMLEITVPSISDPTLAPEGQHVMSVVASYAPYALKTGWKDNHDIFADRIIALIEEYAPVFTSLVTARELLTPVDIEAEYNIEGGHWHHGEMSIDQSFIMRPVHGSAQYDTPVKGLFLCGAAAHPGGGITGIPGHNAAHRILAMGGD